MRITRNYQSNISFASYPNIKRNRFRNNRTRKSSLISLEGNLQIEDDTEITLDNAIHLSDREISITLDQYDKHLKVWYGDTLENVVHGLLDENQNGILEHHELQNLEKVLQDLIINNPGLYKVVGDMGMNPENLTLYDLKQLLTLKPADQKIFELYTVKIDNVKKLISEAKLQINESLNLLSKYKANPDKSFSLNSLAYKSILTAKDNLIKAKELYQNTHGHIYNIIIDLEELISSIIEYSMHDLRQKVKSRKKLNKSSTLLKTQYLYYQGITR